MAHGTTMAVALDTKLTTATRIKQMAAGMLLRHQGGKQVMHALNYSHVSKLLGEKHCTIIGRGDATASMIEIVQDVISTDVASPLLNGVWGLLKTLKALPTGLEPLGLDGVTVEEVALTWRAPEETYPLLTQQVNGIVMGNGASWVRRLTGHLFSSVHVQEIPADEGVALAGSSQRPCVVHVFVFLQVSQGKGHLYRPANFYLVQTLVRIIEKQGLKSRLPLLKVSRTLTSIRRKSVLDSPSSCTAIKSKGTMK